MVNTRYSRDLRYFGVSSTNVYTYIYIFELFVGIRFRLSCRLYCLHEYLDFFKFVASTRFPGTGPVDLELDGPFVSFAADGTDATGVDFAHLSRLVMSFVQSHVACPVVNTPFAVGLLATLLSIK